MKHHTTESVVRILYTGRVDVAEELHLNDDSMWSTSVIFERFDSWEAIIECLNRNTAERLLVVVDFHKTWETDNELSGYRKFLGEYALSSSKKKKNSMLVIAIRSIDGPITYALGYSNLVDAIYFLPLLEGEIEHMLLKIKAQLDDLLHA